MSLGPYLTPTTLGGFLRYGNWTGGGYSANSLSPSFVPLTPGQDAVPGSDGFDAVSRQHDMAYDIAQQNLLSDLASGVPGSTAVLNYLTGLEAADNVFATDAATAEATTSWGQTMQSVGIEVMSAKADMEAAYITKIENDPDLADQLDQQAKQEISGAQAVIAAGQSFDSSNATPDSVNAFDQKVSALLPITDEVSDSSLFLEAVSENPTLLPEVLSHAVLIGVYVTGGTAAYYLGQVIDAVGATFDNAFSEVTTALQQVESVFGGQALTSPTEVTTDVDGGTLTVDVNTAGQITDQLEQDSDGTSAENIYVPGSQNIAQQFTQNSDGTSTKSFFDLSNGSLLMTAAYDAFGNLFNPVINSNITYQQLVGTVADALASQTILQFLAKNNLPLSTASQAFAQAGIQSVTDDLAGNDVSVGSFSENYAYSLANIVGGIAGSDEGAAIFQSLGLPPQLGSITGSSVATAAVQQLTNYITTDILGIAAPSLVEGSVGLAGFVADLGESFESAGLGAAGSILADTLVTPKVGPGSAIGGALGAAIGSFILPGFGTFIGSFIGSIIGGLFGSNPSVGPNAGALVGYSTTQGFYVYSSGEDNGGDTQIAIDEGNAMSQQLNLIIQAIGGTIASLGANTSYSIGYFEGSYYYAPGITAPVTLPNTFADPASAVEAAAFSWLNSLQIINGNPYMLYTLAHSGATNLSDLITDLNVAADYSSFATNPIGFYAALAQSGDPSQLTAWQSELTSAQALGLSPTANVVLFGQGNQIFKSVNFLGYGGQDQFLQTSSGQILIYEFDSNGILIASQALTGANGSPWTQPSTIRIIGTGVNFVGTAGTDVFTQNAEGQVYATEFNSSGTMTLQLPLTDGQGHPWIQASTILILGIGTNFCGTSGKDIFTQNSQGEIFVSEFNASGALISGQLALVGASGAPWSQPSTIQIIGTGVNFGNTGGGNVFTQNAEGEVFAYEFQINGSTAVMTFGSLGTTTGGQQALRDPDGNLWIQPLGIRVIGTGTNFGGTGGNDIFIQNTKGQISAYEFNGAGVMVAAQNALRNAAGNPWLLDLGIRVVGAGYAFNGQPSHDLFTQDATGAVYVSAFNSDGLMSFGQQALKDPAGKPLTLDSGIRVVGTGMSFGGTGGHDIFTQNSQGQVSVYEFNSAGTVTYSEELYSSYGGPWEQSESLDIVGSSTNFRNDNEGDIFTEDSSGKLYLSEFLTDGRLLSGPVNLLTSTGSVVQLDPGDTVIGSAEQQDVQSPGTGLLIQNGAAESVIEFQENSLDELAPGAQDSNLDDYSPLDMEVTVPACFAAGTRIDTTRGQIAIEELALGDVVYLRSGSSSKVVWLGFRRVDCRRHRAPATVWPVRIRPNAFAQGQPLRDLWLSPDHAVHVDDLLIPIKYLINGASTAQEMCDEITYWHVELVRHEVILAEGLPCESYLDTGNRSAFSNGADWMMLHPKFTSSSWDSAYAPLCIAGVPILAIRKRLLKRLPILGYRMTDDAKVEIAAKGKTISAARVLGRLHRFLLPAGARDICITSNVYVPAGTKIEHQDRRTLGVRVEGITANGRAIPLDDPALGEGFHAMESIGAASWRWTNGSATLTLPDSPQRMLLDLLVGDQPRGWQLPASRQSVGYAQKLT